MSFRSSSSIYVLSLEQGKLFVSQCENGRNAKAMYIYHLCHLNPWLEKYYPVDILIDHLYGDIDSYTIEFMKVYGINNVRGGSFSSCCLTLPQIQRIHDTWNNKFC